MAVSVERPATPALDGGDRAFCRVLAM